MLGSNRRLLWRILQMQELIMSNLDNLRAEVAALSDNVAVEIAALKDAIEKAAGANEVDAGIAEQVTKLHDLNAALKASVTPDPTPVNADGEPTAAPTA